MIDKAMTIIFILIFLSLSLVRRALWSSFQANNNFRNKVQFPNIIQNFSFRMRFNSIFISPSSCLNRKLAINIEFYINLSAIIEIGMRIA